MPAAFTYTPSTFFSGSAARAEVQSRADRARMVYFMVRSLSGGKILRSRSVWPAYSIVPRMFLSTSTKESVMKTYHVLPALLFSLSSAWAAGPLAQSDQKLLKELAMANMAEIDTARLA